MFTGLVQAVGRIRSISHSPQYQTIEIEKKKLQVNEGDSVAISGVCHTIVSQEDSSFFVEAHNETLKKTNIGELKIDDIVNLELALKANDVLGGHFIQGHVSCTSVAELLSVEDNTYIKVSIPSGSETLLIPEGSIALDGISLTIARLEETVFWCNIIAHTLEHTNLKKYTYPSKINLEFDMFAQYINRYMRHIDLRGIAKQTNKQELNL